MLKEIQISNWQSSISPDIQNQAIESLESGSVLLFPTLNFDFLASEHIFFTTANSTQDSKNISYDIHQNRLRGTQCPPNEQELLRAMMQRYSLATQSLMKALFPNYRNDLQTGRTSFRPVEIKGRIPKSYRKDDTRLHVDAFPASPLQGRRIMRVFTNVNPLGQSRVWHLGEPFAKVAEQFLPELKRPWPGRGALLKALKITRGYATDYDYAMLQLHNKMKADLDYQKKVPYQQVQFKPGSSWIVCTDHVSHAALEGQYVLEQTFYIPIKAMAKPQYSPLKTLEALMGRELV
jgi:hypothetical protein